MRVITTNRVINIPPFSTNCAGAPRIQFLAGRPNATFPADDGTVPEPQDSVTSILARMGDAGISPAEVIHLLASHTVARSDTLIPGHDSVPFDSTPFTFDTQVFLEVLLKGNGFPFGLNSSVPGAEVFSPIPQSGEMRLQSDFALARDQVCALFIVPYNIMFLHKHDTYADTSLSFCSALLVNGKAW